jgi:hypothetical protein
MVIGVDGVAQSVSQNVEGQDDQHDRHKWRQ